MNTTSRFDQAAAQWDNNPARVELARAVGAAIARAVPLRPDWLALDYGAGTGLLTLNLQPRVASILALDSSTGMLEQLSQKLAAAGISNVQTRLWNLEAQPFPETGFDLVVSSMTLHRLRDVPLVFSRLAALLNPGGWLAAADLDTEDGSFHGDAEDVFHHGFSRPQVTEWLAGTGLTRVSVQDAHTLLKPNAQGEKTRDNRHSYAEPRARPVARLRATPTRRGGTACQGRRCHPGSRTSPGAGAHGRERRIRNSRHLGRRTRMRFRPGRLLRGLSPNKLSLRRCPPTSRLGTPLRPRAPVRKPITRSPLALLQARALKWLQTNCSAKSTAIWLQPRPFLGPAGSGNSVRPSPQKPERPTARIPLRPVRVGYPRPFS